jgi:hypothetical protein
MIMDRVSIILGNKKPHHTILKKAVRIIQDRYNDGFTVNDLTSCDSFSPEEKEYLRNVFSHNITRIEAWEYSFYLEKGMWKYEESEYNCEKIMKEILILLNTSSISIGETVHTDDYRLIESIFRSWLNLQSDEMQSFYEINFNERDFILFISHNLKSRIGDSCNFNFEFLKTFMEAKYDYSTKKITDAVFGIEPLHS